MTKKRKTIILCVAIFILLVISSVSIFLLTREKPTVGNGNVLGVEWYHENGSEFVITTADQLYEFAELSGYYDFKDQTIKLGADIVVNEGNAKDWVNLIPERLWLPIDGFAGTFDGQGYSISGICGLGYNYTMDGPDLVMLPTGLFTDTQPKCVIKNFRILNSYFCSDLNEGVGSITSDGGGTFENIYSDALIVSYKSHNGGLIGMLDGQGSNKISNCWFDGEIRVEGNVGRFSGGLIGRVYNTGGQNKIEHCLNTADLSSTVTGRGMNLGGLVGNVEASARISIEDSLTTGDITVNHHTTVASTVGYVESSAMASIKDVYARAESYRRAICAGGSIKGVPIAYQEAQLLGYESYKWTTLNFKEYWAVVEDGTPILQSFADEIPSIANIEKAYDLNWYTTAKMEYTISNLKELNGLLIMSHSTDFEGQTIRLGNDICINEGDAKEWANQAPKQHWLTIGSEYFPFAGNFDGGMHTISGVYLKTETNCSGLFGAMSLAATVKNLKLTNSYFESSALNFGSVVGLGRGILDTIYSNAIVVSSTANVGGIVGQAPAGGGVSISNCWFDGLVKNTGNSTSDRNTGGIIGYVLSDSNISNCLNSGTIDVTAYHYNARTEERPLVVPLGGGIAGYVPKNVRLSINDSLNVGEIKAGEEVNSGKHSIIGYVDGTVTLYNTYAALESCVNYLVNKSESGQTVGMSTEQLKGYGAYQWTLLDFDKSWAATKEMPVPKAFATGSLNLSGVKKMVDANWYQADKDTYVIDSREDLLGLSLMAYNTDFAKKTIKLGKDITINSGDASKWSNKAPSVMWRPIGTQERPFAGNFDGQMHTVSGIYLKADSAGAGFFGATSKDTVIKNFKLTNSYFESTASNFGSVAGRGQGIFDTVYSDAIVVSSTAHVGGIIGQVPAGDGLIMKNCWFAGSVTAKGNTVNDRTVGGLIGVVIADTTISHSLNSGVIDATAYDYNARTEERPLIVPLAGGIVGHVRINKTLVIEDTLNTGEIKVNTKVNAGYSGIVGYIDGTAVAQNVYAVTESCDKYLLNVSKSGQPVGMSKEQLEGSSAYQWTLLDFGTYWAATKETPVLKAFATDSLDLSGVKKMVDASWYQADKDVYVIDSREDLLGLCLMSYNTDFENKTIKLGKDITVNDGDAAEWSSQAPSIEWMPVGTQERPFAGIFDGQMHTISGIYLKADVACSGLFGATTGASAIKNLRLTNSYFESTALNFGSVAGRGQGIFDTVYSDAIVVSSTAHVGGIIGQVPAGDGLIMKNSWFAGSVIAKGNTVNDRTVGGLIGVVIADTTIAHCLNSGVIDATAYDYNARTEERPLIVPFAGGIVGHIRINKTLVVEDTLNTGEIKVNTKANAGYNGIAGYIDGKLVAQNTYVTVESCEEVYIAAEGAIEGRIDRIAAEKISGYDGYELTMLDFEDYWAVVLEPEESTPILKSFAKDVPSLENAQRMLDISWYKEGDSTYHLSDAADLYGLAMLVNTDGLDFKGKTIVLDKDITINQGDAGDWATNAPKYVWTPIGTAYDNQTTWVEVLEMAFRGTFDGQGHTISGLYINNTNYCQGLFGATGSEATIQNLKLKNSYISGGPVTGAIAAAGYGTFKNIYSDTIVVSASSSIGGIIGRSTSGKVTIEQCWNAGTVTSLRTGVNPRVGGIIGSIGNESSISNCLNTGTITATGNKSTSVAGIAGNTTANVTFTDCLNLGSIRYAQGASGYGSILGANAGGTVEIHTSYGDSEKCTNVCGSGAVAIYDKDEEITTPDKALVPLKDLIGDKAKDTLKGFDFSKKWTVIENQFPVLKEFEDEIFDTLDTRWYEKESYVLSDRGDLYGLAFMVNINKVDFEGKTIKLDKDITINQGDANDWATNAPKYVWTPIGIAYDNQTTWVEVLEMAFRGTFDGQGHTISGLYINNTNYCQGLFGATGSEATIQNLKLKNSYISGGPVTGAIAAAGYGTFKNIYSDNIVVSASSSIGGIIGRSTSGKVTIEQCWNAGTVTSLRTGVNPRVGGIIGSIGNESSIRNCLNTGTITATGNKSTSVAGIAGYAGAATTFTDCLNLGSIKYAQGASGYGAILGADGGAVQIYTSYADNTTCPALFGGTRVTLYDEDNQVITEPNSFLVSQEYLKGAKAADTLKGFDFETVWKTTETGFPVLEPRSK